MIESTTHDVRLFHGHSQPVFWGDCEHPGHHGDRHSQIQGVIDLADLASDPNALAFGCCGPCIDDHHRRRLNPDGMGG